MRAIRLLADQVHADLVAEGVETEEDLKALRTLGIEFAQGFLFSRPRTAEDLIATLLKPMEPLVGSAAIVATSALQASSASAPRATAWAERGGLSLVARAS